MTGRLIRTALVAVIVWAFFVYAGGRALDQEHARAGMTAGTLSEREAVGKTAASSTAPSVVGELERASRSESAPTGGIGSSLIVEEATYQGLSARAWARRAVQQRKNSNVRGRTIRRLRRELASREIGPTLAIRIVFGAHADAALRVAWCESRWHPGAQNGQYLGLFQMGSYARSRYGHSWSPLRQAQAAYRYFVDSGRDWSPWECRP